MKAAVWERAGSPLTIEDIPDPVPKRDEVLVRVSSCGVCHTDLHVIKGEVKFPAPAVLGHEVYGRVATVGEGVTGLEVGDAVVAPFIMPCGLCRFCQSGRDDLCEKFFKLNRLEGKLYDGTTRLFRRGGGPLAMYSMAGLAELSVVPKTALFKIPQSIQADEACILGCAVFTAYGAVHNQAGLKPGEVAAVVGVGGVGSNILQVVHTLGGRTIAIDIRDDKLEAAKSLGASFGINSKTDDPVREAMRVTDGEGVDVAFEALGRPETVVLAFNLVRDGGRVVVVGISSAGQEAGIEITRLVRRGISITGSYGARTRRDMPRVLDLAASGKIDFKKTVTRRYRLDEVNDAYAALERGEIVGRAIVTM